MTSKSSAPGQETIHLNRSQLASLVHLGATTNLGGLERDDPAAFRAIKSVGLFFAANPEMADYAIDIDKITLMPQPDGAPPLVKLQITYKKQMHLLETGPDGRLPDFPVEVRKRKTKRWRKRKREARR